jgi:predicted aspartyl protease
MIFGLAILSIVIAAIFVDRLSRAERSHDPNTVEFKTGKDGRLLLLRGTVNQTPTTFVVDTGATRTIFDVGFKNELGEPLGASPVASPDGEVQLQEFACPSIRFEELKVQASQPVFCFDLTQMRVASGESFTAVLGMDILQQLWLEVDFDKGMLRLTKPVDGSKPAPTLGVGLPITLKAGTPHVEVRSGSLSASFMVDTAASNSCLDAQAFDDLAHTGHLQPGPEYVSLTAVGRRSARIGLLESLEVGPFSHRDLLVEESGMNLLGLSYLSRYRLAFDFPNSVVYLTAGDGFHKPELRGTSGLSLVRDRGKLMVASVRQRGAADVAGVEADDEVLFIGEEQADVIDMFRARQLLTGTPGRTVPLTLARNGEQIKVALVVQDRLGNH